jgi:hypothetical protein
MVAASPVRPVIAKRFDGIQLGGAGAFLSDALLSSASTLVLPVWRDDPRRHCVKQATSNSGAGVESYLPAIEHYLDKNAAINTCIISDSQ